MHVAPADFRSIRNGDLVVRFALLGDTAYVLAEVPKAGSAGTILENPCTRPHWALVVDGSVDVALGRVRRRVERGNAFHVPEGIEHRISAAGSTRIAGFQPLDPGIDVNDDYLRSEGYDILSSAGTTLGSLTIPEIAGESERAPEPGEIIATAVTLGDKIVTRAWFGTRSGYTSGYCDLPHWGVVTAGSLVIEYEDDVEVVTAGDVFHCPGGPPGHRLLAADPAALIDLTPAAAVRSGKRVQRWRPFGPTTDRRRRPRPKAKTVEVAPLA